MKYNFNNTSLIPVESDIGSCCPLGSRSKLYRDRFSKLVINVPNSPRTFTEAEIDLIKSIPYGKKKDKFVGMLNPNRRDRQTPETLSQRLNEYLLAITLFEINGANDKDGCEMAKEQLAMVFNNSNRKSAEILDTLLDGGIIKRIGQKHSHEDYRARHYKFTDKFLNCNFYWKLQSKITTTNTINTMNNQQTLINRQAVIETTIHKYNSPGQHTRHRLAGIDPLGIHYCSCCATERPACLFSISKDKQLYKKCRVCFELESRGLPVREVTLTELDEAENIFNEFRIVAETQYRLWERRNPALAKIKNGTYRKVS